MKCGYAHYTTTIVAINFPKTLAGNIHGISRGYDEHKRHHTRWHNHAQMLRFLLLVSALFSITTSNVHGNFELFHN